MKKTKKIVLFSILGGFLTCFLAVGIFYGSLVGKNNNPSRPEKIDNPTGYVQASGRNLYDGNGDLIVLDGVNLGDWFDQEYWMACSTVGDFETGVYTPKRAEAAMRQNPNLDEEKIEYVKDLYIDEFIKKDDFKNIADLGMNSVRIPFTYINVTSDGYTIKDDAFDKLDEAISWAEEYNILVIIDYHGAIGSQNQDWHSGTDDAFDLYGNRKNMDATIDLWKAVATRYRDNKTVCAYDLLNEPRRAPGKYAGKLNFDFYDELYKAVREIDNNHLIIMECFTFPIHGVNERNYDWNNIAYSYHFYNRTFLSQKDALNTYKAMDNLMGYKVPIIVGEFNAWRVKKDWDATFKFLDNLGWSRFVWTYKANNYQFGTVENGRLSDDVWGFYELTIKPVDLYTATFEEIVDTYSKVSTEYAEKTFLCEVYEERLSK